MIELLSGAFGFVGAFLPEAVKIFRERQEKQHELALMELRLKHAEKEHGWKMEEINTQADIAEMQTLRTPQESFGVQVLDAAKGSGYPNWLVFPVFWLFALLDFISGLVRPGITYAIVAFYMAVKVSILLELESQTGSWAQAIPQIWEPDDKAVLMFVLMFWFGQRAVKAAFGGSASTIKAGT